MDNQENYYNDDGTLAETSWSLRRKKEEEQQKKLEEERLNRERLAQASREFAIQDRKINFQEQREVILEQERRRKHWESMPQWIKAMPRPSLDDPPTIGKKEKLIYKLKKQVVLTDEEKAQRIAQLKKVAMAMDDHDKINKPFLHNHEMAIVSVIPLAQGVGATMLSVALSCVFSLSRQDYGSYGVVNARSTSSGFDRFFSRFYQSDMLKMLHVTNSLLEGRVVNVGMWDVFRAWAGSRYFLANAPVNPTGKVPQLVPKALLKLRDFVKNTSAGVAFFDLAPMHTDESAEKLASVSAVVSDVTIFVVPASSKAPAMMADALSKIAKNLPNSDAGNALYRNVVSNAVIVLSAPTKETRTKEIMTELNGIARACATETGCDENRVFVIPFDEELAKAPFAWAQVGFAAAHVVRTIAATIVDTMRSGKHLSIPAR